jgi:ubiquitin C-terminal hydrolase
MTPSDFNVFGLNNIRNTCYLNSTLQCLFSFSNFREKIILHKFPENSIGYSLQNILITDNKREALKTFIKSLMLKVHWFKFLEHNDINEFISLLFDHLNTEIFLQIAEKNIHCITYDSTPNDKKQNNFFEKAQNKWYESIKNEGSWFNTMMTGQLVNQIICGGCQKIHHNFETFRMLDVEIPNTNEEICIEDCLKEYFKQHFINDDNLSDKWVCDRCKKSNKSLKSCKIVKIPHMLIISLKRFKYSKVSCSFEKNNKLVKFETQLNITYLSTGLNNHICELKSFANHMGSVSSGHYNVCAKHHKNWLYIDDETILKKERLNQRNVYTLFYSYKY